MVILVTFLCPQSPHPNSGVSIIFGLPGKHSLHSLITVLIHSLIRVTLGPLYRFGPLGPRHCWGCRWLVTSLHPKQHLNRLIRFCIAGGRYQHLIYRRHTDTAVTMGHVFCYAHSDTAFSDQLCSCRHLIICNVTVKKSACT